MNSQLNNLKKTRFTTQRTSLRLTPVVVAPFFVVSTLVVVKLFRRAFVLVSLW